MDIDSLSRYYVDMCPLSRYCVYICPHSNYCVARFYWFLAVSLFFFFFDLFIYPEESRYMMNGFRLSPAVGLAFS